MVAVYFYRKAVKLKLMNEKKGIEQWKMEYFFETNHMKYSTVGRIDKNHSYERVALPVGKTMLCLVFHRFQSQI